MNFNLNENAMQSRSRDGSSIEKSTDRQPTKYVNVNENDVINED